MVDRFDGSPEMQSYKNGDYVRYSDYAALEARAEAAERALAERAGGVRVPIGYALVPVEPTDRMVSAYVAAKPKGAGFNHPRKGDDKKAWFAAHEKKCRERWKAMLSVSALTTEPAAPEGQRDDEAVDRFAQAMKAKLERKRAEGRGGWHECSAEYLSELLIEHVKKGDPVDVANLAMMLHQNGQRIIAPEGRQEAVAWQHIPGCGTDRESKMVSVSEGVFCDPCIAPLVAALNAAGFATVASCCGHGHRPSVIALRDGRELFIAKDFNEARQIYAIFPIDINGNTRPAEQAVTEAMVEALRNIDAEAPAKEPRDDWTSTDLDEAFYEGKLRGFWEMAVYAREALTAALGAQTPPEGAVTEAMVEAAAPFHDHWCGEGTIGAANARRNTREILSAALKAAMEAGR